MKKKKLHFLLQKTIFCYQSRPVLLHFVDGEQFTAAAWSLTQPSTIYFSGEHGNLQVWDITKRKSEPFQVQNIAGRPINGNFHFSIDNSIMN